MMADPVTESADQVNDPAEILTAMLAYHEAGLSVIPIDTRLLGLKTDRKRPHPILGASWKPYTERRATVEEIKRWAATGANIAIILGKISGGVYVQDVDDSGWALWLTEDPRALKILKATWANRSGSGGLHVMLRSEATVYSTEVIGAGRHLGEIRGDSRRVGPEYVVMPPSVHQTGGRYATVYGGPDRILKVKDAATIFRALKDAYYQEEAAPPPSDSGEWVMDPLTGQARTDLQKKILGHAKLKPKVKRGLLEGAEWGDGEWTTSASNSEVFHALVAGLVRADFSQTRYGEIEQVFATFPGGADGYRARRSGGSWGWPNLERSILRIISDQAESDRAAKEAKGPGWRIVRVVRTNWEDPDYEITFQLEPDGTEYTATLKSDSLHNDRRFSLEVGRQVNWAPKVQTGHLGRGMSDLARLIFAMADIVQVGEQATVVGHLRNIVRDIISRDIKPTTPESIGSFALGWRDDTLAYVRPGTLYTRVEARRRNTTPEQIFGIIKSWGGDERRFPVAGRREKFWTFPAGVLDL